MALDKVEDAQVRRVQLLVSLAVATAAPAVERGGAGAGAVCVFFGVCFWVAGVSGSNEGHRTSDKRCKEGARNEQSRSKKADDLRFLAGLTRRWGANEGPRAAPPEPARQRLLSRAHTAEKQTTHLQRATRPAIGAAPTFLRLGEQPASTGRREGQGVARCVCRQGGARQHRARCGEGPAPPSSTLATQRLEPPCARPPVAFQIHFQPLTLDGRVRS